MAITVESSPSSLSKLSDSLEFVFKMSSIGEGNDTTRMMYQIQIEGKNGAENVTRELDYRPRSADDNFPIDIRKDARSHIGIEVPNHKESAAGSSLPKKELIRASVNIRIEYWEITFNNLSGLSTEGAKSQTDYITVFNAVDSPRALSPVTESYCFTTRLCHNQIKEGAEDFITLYGAFSLQVAGFDSNGDQVGGLLTSSGSEGVCEVNIGSRVVAGALGSSVVSYSISYFGGSVTGTPTKIIWNHINREERAESVLYYERGLGWGQMTFDYRSFELESSPSYTRRHDYSKAFGSNQNLQQSTVYQTEVEIVEAVTFVKRDIRVLEDGHNWLRLFLSGMAYMWVVDNRLTILRKLNSRNTIGGVDGVVDVQVEFQLPDVHVNQNGYVFST